MPKLIKDEVILDNEWKRIDASVTDVNELPSGGHVLVPLELWLAEKETLKARLPNLGLSLCNTEDLSVLKDDIAQLPVIEIFFPAFMDGRGFSLGRLLRERYGFTGELRAGGQFIRDQLCYLRRCGFNSFAFEEDIDLESAKQSLHDFTDGYQPSVDQPQPLFMRR